MCSATQTSRALNPVHGTCRWVRPVGEIDTKSGILSINGSLYAVILIRGGLEVVKGDGTIYRIWANENGWSCSCPDYVNRRRPGGCKHTKGCRAALAAINVEVK